MPSLSWAGTLYYLLFHEARMLLKINKVSQKAIFYIFLKKNKTKNFERLQIHVEEYNTRRSDDIHAAFKGKEELIIQLLSLIHI